MPDTQKHPDPEMSAAAKIRVAKQPRGAGGRFGATTNAQEARIAEMEAQLSMKEVVINSYHSSLQPLHDYWQAKDPAWQVGKDVVAITLDELRLLTQGNAKLIEDCDHWRAVLEREIEETKRLTGVNASQRDTIQGDRKQIAKLQTALRHVSELLHFRAPAPNESLDDWGSNLRDAYDQAMRADAETLYAPVVAERDRLKGVVTMVSADRDLLGVEAADARALNTRLTVLLSVVAVAGFAWLAGYLLMPGGAK